MKYACHMVFETALYDGDELLEESTLVWFFTYNHGDFTKNCGESEAEQLSEFNCFPPHEVFDAAMEEARKECPKFEGHELIKLLSHTIFPVPD